MLFAFDLVWLDGVDLRQTPLVERKKKLRRLIERSDCSEIIYAQHVDRVGKLLSETWRGLFANGGMGVYSEHGWLKIKNPHCTQTEGRREMFEAPKKHRTDNKSVVRSK